MSSWMIVLAALGKRSSLKDLPDRFFSSAVSAVMPLCIFLTEKNFTTGGYYMEDTLQVFGDMMECQPLSFQEPLGSIQIDRHQAPPLSSYQTVSFNPQKILEAVPSGIGSVQHLNQSVLLLEGDKDCAGNTQCPNGQNRQSENSTEKIEQGWQRIRWTEDMVKVLINAVSYFNEVVSFDGPENERSQIKGKWRSISKTMTERGYVVSPQQCEDKLNDLNKKYKRLNHLLGTDDSFDVVENPALMEPMNIPEEAKEEVRKILACKQLFYREMHSYHHKNKRFLPHDEGLQRSVVFNIKGRARYCCQDVTSGVPAKRRKHGEDDGASDLVNTHPPENKFVGDLISVGPEAIEEEQKLSEWIISRSLEVEAKRVQIQEQRLELEEKKFEWLRLCEVEDEQLRNMKLENELMRLENERLAFEVKCWGRCNDSE